MQLDFDKSRHERLVNNYDLLSKKYDKKGLFVAKDILATINVLQAANSLSDIPHSYRPHPLKGKYKGCFGVDVTRTHRNIFKPNHDGEPNFRIDNYKTITKITIIEIYHNYH